MRRVIPLMVLIAMLFGSTALAVSAQDATPEAIPGATPAPEASLLAELGYPEIRVTTDGTSNDFPSELEAGRYHVVLENQSDMEIDLEFLQLPDGLTIEEVMADFEAAEGPEFMPPDYFFDMVWNGGPTTYGGETSGVVLDLTPGDWVVNLFTYDPATDEQTDMPAMVTVTGEMPEMEEPTAVTDIFMIDMDFLAPENLQTGPQIWRVTNNGLQVHHIVMARVPEGTTEQQVIDLAGTFFAPPAPGAPGATPVDPELSFEDVEDFFFTGLLSRGQFNLYEVDVEPGTYAMICFMPDPSGTPHVMLGMVEIVVVD
jgi:hypothetical protein